MPLLDPLGIEVRAERGDVFGDRARKQLVILQDAADLRAIIFEPDRLHRHAVQQNGAAGRPQQPGEDLQERRLARARRTDNRDALPGSHIEVEVREHGRLVVAVAEADRPRS